MKATLKSRFSNAGRGAIIVLIALNAFLATTASALQLVSQLHPSFAPPAGGDGDSGLSIVSTDGRYVLFASAANNLTLTNNNNSVLPQRLNVFLRDRVNGTTTLVSANLAGTGGGNGDSFPTGISTNGQFALFESAASDLVANHTNGVNDVFVRDVINGTMTLVSVSANGGSANGVSRGSVMTPDGRYVAFVSAATNLVAGDTNGIPDVFVRDLQAGTTTLVSVGAKSTNSTSPFAGSSESPEITPDGRYVVFYSTATNLVPGQTAAGDVYVRDVISGTTAWASASARTLFQLLLGTTNVISYNVCLSANGQYVAFEVSSNGWVGVTTQGMVLRYNLASGLTDVVDMNANVPYLSFDAIHTLAMTPDGRFIAFVGNDNGTSGTTTAIYVWDGLSDSETLASGDLSADVPTNSICDLPAMSADGQWVAFISSATNLTTNTLTGDFHAYLCNVAAGVTQLLDADTNGVGVGVSSTTAPALSADGNVVVFDSAKLLNDNRRLARDVFARDVAAGATDLISARHPALPSQTPDGISSLTPFSVSSNGQFVAFYSDADDIVPNDTNGYRDVFVRDLVLGTNYLVSVNTNGVAGDGISTAPAISGNGRYVAFTSWADDLVPGDTNRSQDVFVRDLQAGTTTLVSVSPDGITFGNSNSFSPQISTDGRYVLFHSQASNLAAGSFGTGIENLFFHDLQTGTTYALTAATYDLGVYAAAMTPDGHWVAFMGMATGTSVWQLYVWDSQLAALTYTNSSPLSWTPPLVMSISPNGQKLVYLTTGSGGALNIVDLVAHTTTTVGTSGYFPPQPRTGLQFSSNGLFLAYAELTNSINFDAWNIYLHNFQAGTDLLVSKNFNSSGAASVGPSDGSDSPAISLDGRFIAYRSAATNIIARDFNHAADVFIYDVSNNATILVSVDAAGASTANSYSLRPVFSADGRTLFFQSWASDLSGNDFNNGSDIFALDLTALPVTISGGGGSTNSSVFYAQFFPAGSFAQNPVVGWPLASGNTYQVQFKNDLSDPVWQNLSGNITFIGDTGCISDPSPASNQRFYRIVLNH
jgi:Tol biopolymer transport system component